MSVTVLLDSQLPIESRRSALTEGFCKKNPTNALFALVGEDPREASIMAGLPPDSRSEHRRTGDPVV